MYLYCQYYWWLPQEQLAWRGGYNLICCSCSVVRAVERMDGHIHDHIWSVYDRKWPTRSSHFFKQPCYRCLPKSECVLSIPQEYHGDGWSRSLKSRICCFITRSQRRVSTNARRRIGLLLFVSVQATELMAIHSKTANTYFSGPNSLLGSPEW